MFHYNCQTKSPLPAEGLHSSFLTSSASHFEGIAKPIFHPCQEKRNSRERYSSVYSFPGSHSKLVGGKQASCSEPALSSLLSTCGRNPCCHSHPILFYLPVEPMWRVDFLSLLQSVLYIFSCPDFSSEYLPSSLKVPSGPILVYHQDNCIYTISWSVRNVSHDCTSH